MKHTQSMVLIFLNSAVSIARPWSSSVAWGSLRAGYARSGAVTSLFCSRLVFVITVYCPGGKFKIVCKGTSKICIIKGMNYIIWCIICTSFKLFKTLDLNWLRNAKILLVLKDVVGFLLFILLLALQTTAAEDDEYDDDDDEEESSNTQAEIQDQIRVVVWGGEL